MFDDEERCETCQFGSGIQYGQVLCYVSYKFMSKWYRCPKWKQKEKTLWDLYLEETKGEE